MPTAFKLKKNHHISLYTLIPILFTIFIVPLACSLHFDKLTDLEKQFITSDPFADFYSYYKALFLQVGTGLSIIIFLIQVARKQLSIHFNWFWKLMIAYGVLIIFASVNSPFQEITYSGLKENYEGMWSVMAYLSLSLMAFTYSQQVELRTLFLKTIVFSALSVAIFVFLVFFDGSFFSNELLKFIFLGEAIQQNIKIDVTAIKHAFVGTLYNPNFLASYSILIYFLTLSYIHKGKSRFNLFMAGLNAIYLTILLGTKSEAALLAIAGGLGVYLLFTKEIKTVLSWLLISWMIAFILHYIQFKIIKDLPLFDDNTISLSFFILLLLVILLSSTLNYVTTKYTLTWNRFKTYLIVVICVGAISVIGVYFSKVSSTSFRANKRVFLEEVTINKNRLFVKGQQMKGFYIKIVGEDVSIVDEEDKAVNIKLNQKGQIELLSESYNDVYIKAEKKPTSDFYSFLIIPFNLHVRYKERTFYFKTANLEYPQIENADSFGFKGLENFASYRGYIWSRLLPKLKDKTMLGYGIGSTVCVFPHNDFVNRFNIGFDPYQIVYKPHSWYLQIVLSTGVLSLVVILSLLFFYLKKSTETLFKGKSSPNHLNLGVLSCVFAYILISIFYDSYIGVAPLFWTLLGVGTSFLSQEK